jgi:hypothetical protein
MNTETKKCPVCDGAMKKSDLPKHSIYICQECSELGHLVDGTMQPISALLERHGLGDDRLMAATSQPHVTTAKSFIEISENTSRSYEMEKASAASGLRACMRQMENLCDSALQIFTGQDLISDEAAKGLTALRELRELISTRSRQTRGVIDDDSIDSAVSPSE